MSETPERPTSQPQVRDPARGRMLLAYASPALIFFFTLYVSIQVVRGIPPVDQRTGRESVIVGTALHHLSFHADKGTALIVLVIGALLGGSLFALIRTRYRAHADLDSAKADAAIHVKQRKELEMRLMQSQKMESVGRLAGGIAHDFNNLLTVIIGETQMAMGDVAPDGDLHASLREVLAAGHRAAGLTRQLLAFSRQQVFAPTVFSLNDLVVEADKMLRRMIGEDVHLVTHPTMDLRMVRADRGQIEQVLMNLVVNARDAMPEGGQLTLETANVTLDKAYAALHPTVQAGDYVMLAVTDTGTGMTEEVQEHIFEPFFTTKPAGKGTGLGLATVFGIVKQSGGHVAAYSEVGKGTTFKVYLPRVETDATTRASVAPPAAARGTETILIAEDDSAVRAFMRRALATQGYMVLAAEDGAAAMRIARQYPDPIDLIITDVVMPDLSGPDLVQQVSVLRPGLLVLFSSGYTGEAMAQQKVLESGVPFLQKPFSVQDLAHKVRAVLDAKTGEHP